MVSLRSRRPPRFWWRLGVPAISLLIILLVLLRFTEEIGPDRHPADRFLVVDIRDGDTMVLQGGDRLRLLSIDTPEKGEPLYEESCQLLRELAIGQQVRIEFAGRRRDKYGRLLGYAYIDTLFVNKMVLDSGLGYLYLFRDTELQRAETDILLGAQRQALAAGVGLWSLVRPTEEYYLAKPGLFRFHRPGCRHVRTWSRSECLVFDSREAALFEGLSPCRTCKP